MDRAKLNQLKSDLSNFIQAINQSEYKLDYACLIPAFEGESNGPLILQVNAGWVKKETCSVAIDIVVDYLFQHTTVETRMKIYRIDVYDENGKWQCTSRDYVLVGEIPNVF